MNQFRIIIVLICLSFIWAGNAFAGKGVFNPSVTPDDALINVDTTITVSAELGGDYLYISSVGLYQTTATGQPIRLISQMYDDGTHGDVIPTNSVFTAQFVINQPTESKFYVRVTAAYKGDRNRYMSPVLYVDIHKPFPACEELTPSQEQIDAAVAEAIAGIDNPWGNVNDFELLLHRVTLDLRCDTKGTTTTTASARILQQAMTQATETCAKQGVDYCGPGTSEKGTTLHTGSACLNEACCQHDTCYGVKCIDGDCYWTTQTQECDTALRSVCDSGCNLDIRGRVICSLVRHLDDQANSKDHPECSNPASCNEGPTPDCAGQTCETFTNCNPGSACDQPVCGTIAEGGGLCVEGTTACAGLADCKTSADCGGKGLCFVDSCCGRGVCVPTAAFCPDIGAKKTMKAAAKVKAATVQGLTIGGYHD